MSVILTTSRVIVKPFPVDSFHLLWEMNSDERVAHFIPRRNKEETQELFQRMQDEYAANPRLGRWALFEKASGDFVGMCMLIKARLGLEGMEIGYSLNFKYWGQGIATEVVKAVVDYGFSTLLLGEIKAITVPENIASQKVLEKVGFISNEMLLNGQAVLLHVFKSVKE